MRRVSLAATATTGRVFLVAVTHNFGETRLGGQVVATRE